MLEFHSEFQIMQMMSFKHYVCTYNIKSSNQIMTFKTFDGENCTRYENVYPTGIQRGSFNQPKTVYIYAQHKFRCIRRKKKNIEVKLN